MMNAVSSSMVHANQGDVIKLTPEGKNWILLYIRKGSALCTIGSHEEMLFTKTVLIVPPEMSVIILPKEYYEHIFVQTTEQFFPGKSRFYLLKDIMDTADTILWLVFRQMDRKLTNYDNVVSSLMEALRQFLLAQVDRGPNTDVIDLEQLLRQNISNPSFDIEEVLQQIPQTTSYTRRLFHRAYGCSPLTYLNNLRMNAAKILLMTQNLPINEVALQCGFSDAKYFSRRFHQTTGQSPSEFKRKHVKTTGITRA